MREEKEVRQNERWIGVREREREREMWVAWSSAGTIGVVVAEREQRGFENAKRVVFFVRV